MSVPVNRVNRETETDTAAAHLHPIGRMEIVKQGPDPGLDMLPADAIRYSHEM